VSGWDCAFCSRATVLTVSFVVRSVARGQPSLDGTSGRVPPDTLVHPVNNIACEILCEFGVRNCRENQKRDLTFAENTALSISIVYRKSIVRLSSRPVISFFMLCIIFISCFVKYIFIFYFFY